MRKFPPSVDQTNAQGRRNGLLDLLRFAAALMVVLYHFLYRGAIDGGYLEQSYGVTGEAISLGYLGINLFFMISGYVIIWSASNRDWYGFSLSRLARLYPAHLVAMTITAIMMALWATPPLSTSFAQWLANLTMLAPLFGQNFMDGAYWSIVIELLFYAWVMIGLFSGVLPRHTDLTLAVWLSLVVANNLFIGSRPFELMFLTEYGAYFAFGALVWRMTSHGPSTFRLFLAGLALVMTLHTAEVQRYDVILRLGEASSATATATASANLGIIALFLLAATLGGRFKAGPWMLALGGISYPLYLIHQNAGYILINLTAPGLGKWAALTLATGLSLAVSWWIYACIEPGGRSIIRALFTPAARYLPRTTAHLAVPAE